MKKPKPIRALDVVPDKWYMAHARVNSKDITWQPCKVFCGEHGWERGYVLLEFGTWIKASVQFADTRRMPQKTASVFVSRDRNTGDLIFADSSGRPTLIELDVSLLNRALNNIKAELSDLELRKQSIEEILEQVLTIPQ